MTMDIILAMAGMAGIRMTMMTMTDATAIDIRVMIMTTTTMMINESTVGMPVQPPIVCSASCIN